MPEGHSIRHYANVHHNAFVGTQIEASSPQGRFAKEAAKLNGQKMTDTSAHGKHLFFHFEEDIVHIHLGLYGTFNGSSRRRGSGFKEPNENTRLRLRNEMFASDLSAPTRCELIDDAGRQYAISKLGPDPIHEDSDPQQAFLKIHKSSRNIGGLLMDQSIIAGIGNVYRAELLFMSNLSPFTPGMQVPTGTLEEIWENSRRLLRLGSEDGMIRTVDEKHLTGEEITWHGRNQYSYVYKRTGQLCRLCSSLILSDDISGRTVYWCPTCQS